MEFRGKNVLTKYVWKDNRTWPKCGICCLLIHCDHLSWVRGLERQPLLFILFYYFNEEIRSAYWEVLQTNGLYLLKEYFTCSLKGKSGGYKFHRSTEGSLAEREHSNDPVMLDCPDTIKYFYAGLERRISVMSIYCCSVRLGFKSQPQIVDNDHNLLSLPFQGIWHYSSCLCWHCKMWCTSLQSEHSESKSTF